ncbi:LysR family transcriptional regulator [Methylophaga sulfidovorans]|uniref:Transcriptional regulator, LysR family n=1 Tax=Methylophaga sulfidovorans TaxID=45496 RepID=A0A1I4B8Y4_9GAMM|nr:LysR family transcriptional regulator [Methylophaga sulfidovorans]SFK65224.1 transcriptional regulator, LysR family [Methylophaga sulfidovorans]
MNIEHLKLFIRIAATQNISAAGNELGLSPAVASAYINKLEKNLGVRLLHRTTRQVSLTEEGKSFLPHAEDVLASVEAARSAVGAGETIPSGTLRIAAPASFARMHLVPALKGFTERYPNLILDLRLSDSIVDMVEGGFDVAIRNAELKDSNLIARKLAPDSRVLCASPDYIAEHGIPSSPEDIKNHHCITLTGLDTWHFQTPTGPISIRPNSQVRVDNGEAARDACALGLGLTINAKWSTYELLAEGKLVTVLDEFPLVSKTAIWAVYPSSRLLAPKVSVFIEYLIQQFGPPPYWDIPKTE